MRHKKKKNLLSRPADQRRALLRTLTTQVLRHGRIQTTEAKAKAVKREVDRMITLAKRADLNAHRQVSSYLLEMRRGQVKVLTGKEATNIDEALYQVVSKDDKAKKAKVREKTVAQRLFQDIAPRYAERHGGYTRVLKLPPRRGDGAPMALIELV